MNIVKQKILDKIQETVEVFNKVSDIQYAIRCPICGDSNKDSKATHLYLKCSHNPDEPILYKCFKCNSSGRVSKWFLDKIGVPSNEIGYEEGIFNKISSGKKVCIDVLTGQPDMESDQVGYIEYRLGNGLQLQDFDRFKIVWNMNSIIPYITNIRVKNTLPSNRDSVSFLSDDKSTLLTRFFSDEDPRWRKTKLFQSDNKSFYTIKTTLDLFTKDRITINIAEGIFDVLSVYKNFTDNPNSIYIATLGLDYESGIHYAIKNGFVGSNIVVRVYVDSDIDDKALRYKLKKYKWIFNSISVLKNIKSNDFGVMINDIKTIEYHV